KRRDGASARDLLEKVRLHLNWILFCRHAPSPVLSSSAGRCVAFYHCILPSALLDAHCHWPGRYSIGI
ncbi:hypothetical protein, partial [Pantoea agglomerans]|uniref:hypothetical protein n=1 Tax=Enterobacter agglomerans TaxID=549 RepID=UPI001CA41521